MKFYLKLLFVTVYLFGLDPYRNQESLSIGPFIFKERINLSSDLFIESRDFVVINNYAYLLSTDGYYVHRMDLATKKVDKMTGGQGNGPGEFSGVINSLSAAYGRIFVSTLDLWAHEFDKDLKLIQRKIAPSNYVNFSALTGGNMVVCNTSFERASQGGTLYGMEVIDRDHVSKTPTGKFVFSNQLSNMMLSRCFVASGPKYVLYAQLGEAAVYFYDHSGSLVKKVPFENWTSEMRYLGDSTPNPATQMLESFGFRDHRTPMGGYINSLNSSDSYSLVQGGVTTPDRFRSMAIIDHKTWNVYYTQLPQRCRNIRLQSNIMYCLITDGEVVAVDSYEIDLSNMK